MFRAQFPAANPYVPLQPQALAASPATAQFSPSITNGPQLKPASTQWLQRPAMLNQAHDFALADVLHRLHNSPLPPATEVGGTLFCRMQGLAGIASAVLIMQRDHGHAAQPAYDLSSVVLEMHQQPGQFHPYLAPHAPRDIEQYADLCQRVLASPILPEGGLVDAGSLTWLHEDLAHLHASQQHTWRIQPDIDALVQRIWSGQMMRVPMPEGDLRIRRYSIAQLPSAPNNLAAAAQLEFHAEPTAPHCYQLRHVVIGLPGMQAMTLSGPEACADALAPLRETAGVQAPICLFKGAEYRMESLGLNDFAARLRAVHPAPGSRANTAWSVGFNPASLLSPADKKREAQRHLHHLAGNLLSQHPERLEAIKAATLEGITRFTQGDVHRLRQLHTAFNSYVSDSGYHVFMNAILEGHKELTDFLQPMGLYHTKEDIEAYCKAFIDEYGEISHFEPEDLKDAFRDDLQEETQALRDFLEQEGVPLNGITLAHGVMTGEDSESSSVAVNGEGYMKAFIEGDPVLYKSFFSTTADLDTALNFASKAVMLDMASLSGTAIDTLDLKDQTPIGLAQRQEYHAHIAADDLDRKALLVFAKGADGQGNFLWPGITNFHDEQEMLLGPDHVLVPERIIRGQDYYVLVAELSRLDEADSDSESESDSDSASASA